MTDQNNAPAPLPGDCWAYYNGTPYRVLHIANLPDNPWYPQTVVYQGSNGRVWARPLSDWHRSMTLTERADRSAPTDNTALVEENDRLAHALEALILSIDAGGATLGAMSDARVALASRAAPPTDNTALVEALTPFADISREGVVTVKEGHVNIVTCAEYFHRAAAALASHAAPPAAQEGSA